MFENEIRWRKGEQKQIKKETEEEKERQRREDNLRREV